MLPLSIELKNSCEAYTCIYSFLLVIMLMNICSEFLVLLFPVKILKMYVLEVTAYRKDF